MALASGVRCLLLTIFVILNLSGKSECLTSKVKNGEQIESNIGYYRNENVVLQTIGEFKGLPDEKSSSDGFISKDIQDNTLNDSGEKKCRNKLCEIFDRHRVIRQIRTGYLLNPQPQTYPQQGYQNNNYKPPTNNYGNYSNTNNNYQHYPNSTQYRPGYNTTFTQLPNSNNFSYSNPGFSSSSKHTYPPSPRPNYSQYPSNTRFNTSIHSPNNLHPNNRNRTTIIPFYSTTMHPQYPNYYPSYNGNVPSINSTSYIFSRFGLNNTQQNFNYPNNHNSRPAHTFPNTTNNYPYDKHQNNSSPYNSFTQRAPLNPYPNQQRNATSTYPYNHVLIPGMNSTHVNNYNPGPYYPKSNNPFGPTSNITQNKFPSNPNPFYYLSNYNGPQYDPLRQPPERFSY